MAKKNNNWSLADMQATLVKDTEERIEQGFEDIRNESESTPAPAPQTAPTATIIPPAQAPKEPTKGIQTDVPMSLYQRLVMMKLRRGEPICSMMIQALRSWLDAEERAMQVATVPTQATAGAQPAVSQQGVVTLP